MFPELKWTRRKSRQDKEMLLVSNCKEPYYFPSIKTSDHNITWSEVFSTFFNDNQRFFWTMVSYLPENFPRCKVLRRFVTELSRKSDQIERRNWKRPDWYFCWMRKKSFKWTWWTAWTTWTNLLFRVHFVYFVHLVHKMPVCAKNTR